MPFYSPLRYPGGKRKLGNYVLALLHQNRLNDHVYLEPYAGGAAVALHLLLEHQVPTVWINDVDTRIGAFWHAVRDHSEELCRRISSVSIDLDQWKRQRHIYVYECGDVVDVAFATLFLNRTNRSGVLLGGIIGGKEQRGKWKMGARFNRQNLIARIEAIADQMERIRVTCMDAVELLTSIASTESDTFVFLDPPYYHKVDRRLYWNDYTPEDHERIADVLLKSKCAWLLTYDDCEEIRALYGRRKAVHYSLCYTAGRKRRGAEVLFASSSLSLPPVDNPERLSRSQVKQLRCGTLATSAED